MLQKKYKVSCSNMALLTPYAGQKDLLKDMIKQRPNLRELTLCSINESQGNKLNAFYTLFKFSGDEYDIVILSTVRSLPLSEIKVRKFVQPDRKWMRDNLGFLTDFHQLNVGITRAKHGLIIIG